MDGIEASLRFELESWRGASIASLQRQGGGCISQAATVEFTDRFRCFVKWNSGAFLDAFEAEADGLLALRRGSAIRAPSPLGWGITSDGRVSWLVMDEIKTRVQGRGFFAEFGRALASWHRSTQGELCGWERNNFLGASPQTNRWRGTWPEFFRECRWNTQWALAERNGLVDDELRDLRRRAEAKMEARLGECHERPVLLHGDLWSGNYLCDTDGHIVLIDPAVSMGPREMEFGMICLFGGCDPSFFTAYESEYPLEPSWRTRLPYYVFYHLINHLNLFGASYRSQCLAQLRAT